MTHPHRGSMNDVIQNLIQILERMIEDKIRENQKLRKQVYAQRLISKKQGIQIIELANKIKLLEEMDSVDAADVINLDWEECEFSTSHISEDSLHKHVPQEQVSWIHAD